MIRRHTLPSLAALWAASLATGAVATAQPLPQERVSSWRTTTHIDIAPLPRQALPPVITGSLPPEKPARSLSPSPLAGVHKLDGIASFYWQDQKTANGEQFDKNAMTAAHKTLPFGTRVRVTNTTNQRSVVVRINDRGPFIPGRVIDLSLAAANVLDMQKRGLAPVKVEVVK